MSINTVSVLISVFFHPIYNIIFSYNFCILVFIRPTACLTFLYKMFNKLMQILQIRNLIKIFKRTDSVLYSTSLSSVIEENRNSKKIIFN
ncbi:hypothetical protein KUTeg_020619, partial [Tegillarca granosa]